MDGYFEPRFEGEEVSREDAGRTAQAIGDDDLRAELAAARARAEELASQREVYRMASQESRNALAWLLTAINGDADGDFSLAVQNGQKTCWRRLLRKGRRDGASRSFRRRVLRRLEPAGDRGGGAGAEGAGGAGRRRVGRWRLDADGAYCPVVASSAARAHRAVV